MDYYCYEIQIDEARREIILAFLGELPFDSFEELPQGLNAYIPAAAHTDETETQVAALGEQFAFRYERRFIPAQNWNAVWESNFQPIRIGDFCAVRASFHPSESGVQHEILINPQMAFGTGHHATTYLMMEQMQHEDFDGAAVLDFGCGTGILAILAAKMGAAHIDAVDIEQPAYENTLENAALNGTPQIAAYHGTLETVPLAQYGLILANINRNVILNSLGALYQRLAPNGVLLVSGILLADEQLVLERAARAGFSADLQTRHDEWCCLRFSH
jgi:ribosomal protein L11 methyltransferase